MSKKCQNDLKSSPAGICWLILTIFTCFRHFISDIRTILKSMILTICRLFKSGIQEILKSMILIIVGLFKSGIRDILKSIISTMFAIVRISHSVTFRDITSLGLFLPHPLKTVCTFCWFCNFICWLCCLCKPSYHTIWEGTWARGCSFFPHS